MPSAWWPETWPCSFSARSGTCPSPVYGASRSGKWPALEKRWLELHGECAACGSREQLSAHHKRPFHLDPDLELDPGDAKVMRKRVEGRRYE